MPKRIVSLRRAFEPWSATAQRVTFRWLRPYDVSAEVRKKFATIDAAFVGQIDDAHVMQGAAGLRHWRARF